ncbi:ArnT family glycosyltransferase [Zhouia amylolytica]|uniref:PMT family glycosyltransferase, 4-amino-4-deoxy-L-arabinose transferase n=1 Tax=Zhouia amylolytica AD3 TaxID=1286632 RepID=W2URU6_9FLAO|nr:glycosyltransferase family 39 protein [Zhouia amylolytica]ETN96042.1 PMT family glycosyltransferase, 4-amino-4-deoxy-L-arabinose transferase [Zhouia amylolytica AD3]
MLNALKNNYPILILLVCASIFFSHLGTLYINIMEARNFITAREIINNNEWLLTTMNGLPRYEKPPLPTWLTAITGSIFGMKSLFGLRLPAALIVTFLIWMCYELGIKIHNNKRLSFITSLILASSFYIIFSGRNGQWDIFTHGFMIAAIYYLFLLFQQKNKVWIHTVLASLFFGASFLSKGPVSPYALWLPFIIAYGIAYKFTGIKNKIGPIMVFLLIGLGLGASWFIYVRLADPEAFLAITTEETANWSSYNVRPFYYYWSFFTQSGIWTIPSFIALLYPYLKNKVSNPKAYKLSFWWTISAVILLSIIPEKKSRYLLPVLIPMAMNTAFYIEYLINHFKELKNKKETYPVYFNFGLIALIGLAFPIGGYVLFNDKLEGSMWLYFITTSVLLFTIGLFILKGLKQKNISNVFLLTIGFIMTIMTFGFPISKVFNTNTSFKNVDTLAASSNYQNLNIYSFGELAPEMVWLYGREVPRLDVNGMINTPTKNNFGVLVTLKKEDLFKDHFSEFFDVKLIDTYDVNYTASPDQKKHKSRLVANYYILTAKTSGNSL